MVLSHLLAISMQAEETPRSPTRAPSLFNSKVLPDGSEWVIQSSEIELGRRIGSGSFGEVFRAQWRHTDVAVKRVTNVTQEIVGVRPPTQTWI